AGTTLALPFLDSLSWAAPAERPQRLAFLFVPNGMHMQDWTPKAAGASYELPWLLEPLAPVRNDMLVLSGLTHDKGRANGDGPGDHARSAAVYLTGAQPYKTAGSDIKVGKSVDQIAADAIGRRTKLRSLELGCEGTRVSGQCDSGYSCAYSSNISWRTPHTPMLKEMDPRLVFERLFGGRPGETKQARARRLAARKSILDFVAADAKDLRKKIARSDRKKLDEYFDGVREVERRIEMAEAGEGPVGVKRPDGIPREYVAHVRLMYDLLALAFQTDTTRVATFMLANEGSNRTYPFIGVRGGHHHISHHGGDKKKIEGIRRINRFHTEQLAYFLNKLKTTKDGDGTLLDNSLIVYGSGISDGNRHNHDDLPVLVAGRGGGTLTPGRHVRYARNTPMNNLYLSLLDRVGVNETRVGDSTGRLAGLTT
ncbi:MAG: DUF1552 domain-containing protein, partial [Planctomycetota bacterium]|nr:DUF1552 domain-containing protein [Planctomycetota bacterium]